MKRLLFTAAIVLCTASVAMADARFEGMDKNKNGKVSWKEFEAANPQMRKPAFEAIDANSDDAITQKEWEAFQSRHGKGGEGMGATMGGMGGTSSTHNSEVCTDPSHQHNTQQNSKQESKPLIQAPKK